jgi:hypothetical protein
MNNARVIITVGGYFDSLPAATKDFVLRKLRTGEQKFGWRVTPADQRGSQIPGFDLNG